MAATALDITDTKLCVYRARKPFSQVPGNISCLIKLKLYDTFIPKPATGKDGTVLLMDQLMDLFWVQWVTH